MSYQIYATTSAIVSYFVYIPLCSALTVCCNKHSDTKLFTTDLAYSALDNYDQPMAVEGGVRGARAPQTFHKGGQSPSKSICV